MEPCFPKHKSQSIACVIGYCVCLIVAFLGQCYQREQLGKFYQGDPVAVGIIRKRRPSRILIETKS